MNSLCHWRRLPALALSLGLAGCGDTVVEPAVTVPPARQAAINSTANFGDSITCAFGASAPALGYAALLDAAIAKPATNYCRPGDQAADMTRLWVYPNTVPTAVDRQLYTILIGTNDANSCGPKSGCLTNYSQALQASLAWLGIPSADKILAVNCTQQSGPWTPDLINGLATTAAGASLTFNVNQTIANHHLYVGYRVFDSAYSNPAFATLSLDGIAAATLSSSDSTDIPIATSNHTGDTIYVASLNLGQPGPHTVRIVTASPGANGFSLQWVGVASQSYAANPSAPHVVIGQIPTTTSATLNATVATYNQLLTALVAGMVADGLNLTIAPTNAALDPATDFSDELHPDNAGHVKLAIAFAGVL